MADTLTLEQRSRLMSRIRGKDTGPERRIRSELHRRGYRFRKHVKELPGKPDVVFTRRRVAVFVDGDFWHGHGFGSWGQKLSPHWREKILRNMERDVQHRKALEEQGWTVVRIWEHEVKADLEGCVDRIASALSRD